jgi:branched-subunit amino acid transport protein
MGAGGGVVLRLFNFAIRVLQFVDAAIILAIFSFYLAVLTENQLAIAQWIKATEGLAGAATLYGILGSLFTCCLGGVAFFAALAIFLDVCFVGAMIAIAILTRNGAQSCSGTVNTPLGSGSSNSDATSTTVNLGTACRLEKVAFALAILGV